MNMLRVVSVWLLALLKFFAMHVIELICKLILLCQHTMTQPVLINAYDIHTPTETIPIHPDLRGPVWTTYFLNDDVRDALFAGWDTWAVEIHTCDGWTLWAIRDTTDGVWNAWAICSYRNIIAEGYDTWASGCYFDVSIPTDDVACNFFKHVEYAS
jgi:hypothetical protein